MKLAVITLAQVSAAAQQIDTDGIPANRVWSQYYVVFNGKEYPFKYLAYTALKLVGEQNVRFESNDGYRNYFQNGLGLEMRYYEGGYNFFTREELDYYASIVGQPYRKDNPAHQLYPNKLSALIAKVNYWATATCFAGYQFKHDRGWLTSHSSDIRPYIWPRLYKEKDVDIFFNVEVNGKDRFIGYKLDGYIATTKRLTEEQQQTLQEFKQESGWTWAQIPFDRIADYNWDRLIRETQAYIRKLDTGYDLLRKRLYKETKLVRITWNTNGWQKPSGRRGKALNKTYEHAHGFVHEEWLFDADTLIDGYKYGFLEPIHQNKHLYIGKVYDLSLFTRNSEDSAKYWVTTLKNVEVITAEEAIRVQTQYEQSGWFQDMKDDLRALGLDIRLLSDWIRQDRTALFNIRFRASQLNDIPTTLIPVDEENDIPGDHYVLYNIGKELAKKYRDKTKKPFDFGSGSLDGGLKGKGKRRSFTTERELEFKHNKLQEKLLAYLQNKYGDTKTRRECESFGCRIDVVRETDAGYIFYEIKTYNNLLTSIRLGVGQLLEYHLFPNAQIANELVLVSHIEPSEEIKAYFIHLRSFFNDIKLSYMHFDPDEGEVIGEI